MAALTDIIRDEIAKNGPIPFARFMELALYCPEYGYYETERDKIGRRGDYFTSVSVGNLFGELLARQFVAWAGKAEKVEIIEAGAHDGTLARDILTYVKEQEPEVFERLGYVITEPSEIRKKWQRETLAGFAGAVSWVSSVDGLSNLPALHSARIEPLHVNGPRSFRILFSNELLDAFPTHRLAWNAHKRQWMECRVEVNGNEFGWTEVALEPGLNKELELYLQLAVPEPAARETITRSLPNGYVLELCPAARAWWRSAAKAVGRGKLVTIDYGLAEEELLKPERTNGTLRAFRAHRASTDLLVEPGKQDVTSHVNFPALIETGESCGLKTEVFLSHERFLTGILSRPNVSIEEWSPQRKREFLTLTHPQQLGSAFRVLVQRLP